MLVAAMALVAVPRVRRHHPFERIGPANAVTSARAVMVAFVAALLPEPPRPSLAAVAVLLAAIVAILDGVDGWLARRTGMTSAFGARFDVEVDALLILVLALLCWRYGKAGGWVLLSGLARYLFVASGWIWSWMRAPLAPTSRGRAICVVQIAGLIIALTPVVPPSISSAVAAASLVALMYSFGVDTLRLWRPAQ